MNIIVIFRCEYTFKFKFVTFIANHTYRGGLFLCINTSQKILYFFMDSIPCRVTHWIEIKPI